MIRSKILPLLFSVLILGNFSGWALPNPGLHPELSCESHLIQDLTEGRVCSPSKRIKTRVIINPKSGNGNKENLKTLIDQFLDSSEFDFEIFYTNCGGHATELSREAAILGYGLVVAVGGDGTINEIGKELIGTQTAMGLIPSGSGNGLAKHLNISSDPKQAIQTINRFQYISIDTIQINNDHFIGIAGIGFDAHIAWEFANSKQRGFWSYVGLVLREYSCYAPQTIEMIVDGEKVKKDGLLLSFANGSQYGNDIKIAPQAKLCDGYLDIVVLKKPPLYALLDVFLKLREGTITHSKYYESFCCKEAIICNKKMMAHIDGEPVFFEDMIKLKVLPRSLKVIIP